MKTKGKKRNGLFITVMIAVIVVLLGLAIALPAVTISYYDSVLRDFFGTWGSATGTGSSSEDTADLDTQYYKNEYATEEELDAYEETLVREMAADGYVLLKNDTGKGGLPLAAGSSVSLFSHSSVDIVAGGTGSGTGTSDVSLKEAFTDAGFEVNGTLWDFYESGKGSSYTRGSGSIQYGVSENWQINECPLSVLESNGVLSSAEGTTPIYVISRTGGEGRDLARGMQKWTDIAEDQEKHYLEIDSVEEEIISYLNDNFDDVIVLVNTNNVFETGFLEEYENISAALWVPGGGGQMANSVVDVLSGAVTPSGHLVDTMAYDAFSSPAVQNMGDFEYTNGGSATGYYGVSYDEGIYVGYKYYETRYADKVNGVSDVGDYDYSGEVQYPFGYGLSYTAFEWSNFQMGDMDEDGDITLSVDVRNTGDVAGREVVEFYLSSPYTDYDKANYVEKAAVSLVEFGKTDLLEPDESATVEVTVNVKDFVSYDDCNAETYILDAGEYLLTAAADAHAAVNNVLAYGGKTADDGMTEEGDASFVGSWTNSALDTETYSTSSAGVEITNRFDYANYIDRTDYLTRQDWMGTWPEMHGTQSASSSSYSERTGYTYYEEIDDELYAKLTAKGTMEAADNPGTLQTMATSEYGQDTGYELINYRGLTFEEADWDALVLQMTTTEVGTLVNVSGYHTAKADSINKPATVELDGPMGMNTISTHATYSISYPAEVTIAATWDRSWATLHGDAVAEDSFREDVSASGWYAPAVNIHRTPFAGRNFEYYSEDGTMNGIFAIRTVRAAAEKGVYTYFKHFALNDQEDHRSDEGLATWSNEQAMREIYLEPFRMVVEESGTVTTEYYVKNSDGDYELTSAETPACTAIMSSYNRIGYVWAGGNYNLITEVLRGEWGFTGTVLTDYSTGSSSYMHTEQMLYAGGDVQLTQQGLSLRLSSDNAYYCMVAVKHLLYTIVNSKAMNGFIEGTTAATTPFANYYLIIIGVDALCAGGIAVCAVFLTKRILRMREAGKGTQGSGITDEPRGGAL